MPGAFEHCAELVRETDKDRFLAALFAPVGRRRDLYAIYAFDLETAQIAERVREPLAGEMRLQWWREVLDGVREGEAAGNPVAAALLETIRDAEPLRDLMQQLLDGRGLDNYAETVPSLAALEAYALQTEGAVMRAAVMLLADGSTAGLDPLVAHAAAAVTIVHALRKFAAHAARGRLYIPADLLTRHDAGEDDVRAGRATPGLLAALADLRDTARRHIAQARELLPRAPAAVRPAFLHVAILPLVLDRMDRIDYDPFKTIAEAPQWRRQWRLWRAARGL